MAQALYDANICVQMRNLLEFFVIDIKFLPHFCLLDQFVIDAASTVIQAPGHQMVSLICSVCQEEKAHFLSPLMNIQYFVSQPRLVVCILCTMYVFLLTKLSEVPDRLKQGPLQSPRRVDKLDTSGDETYTSKRRSKFLWKKIFRKNRVYGASELGKFFVTGPMDAANKCHFRCQVC